MKHPRSNRKIMSIRVFVVVASIALSSYTIGLKFDPNFTLDSNDDDIISSSVLVPPRMFEANAQTIIQNNTDTSLRQLFERTQQSVVQVSGSASDSSSLFSENLPSRPATLGSGFVYDREGHIVTNYHVIAGADPENIDVTFSDGTVYRARVIGTDQYSDLAVL